MGLKMKKDNFDKKQWALIASLDLGIVKNKLIMKKGWSNDLAGWVENKYKEFLYLTITNPSETIVPSEIVDDMWHAHILDTRKYADDCEFALGGFLHHFPYLGLRGEEDLKYLKESFNSTKEILSEVFSSTYELPTAVAASCHGGCSGAVATTLKDIGASPVAASCHGSCSGAVATTLTDIGASPVAADCHGGCSGAVATTLKDIGAVPMKSEQMNFDKIQ